MTIKNYTTTKTAAQTVADIRDWRLKYDQQSGISWQACKRPSTA